MKIVAMGAGGVNGYFGALLQKGGADVAFVARGKHLAAMRDNGLTVEESSGNLHLPNVAATDDPATLGVADIVLFSVKLWDTPAALLQIKPLVGPHTAIISLQNGVAKDDAIRAAYGETNDVGGVAYVSAHIARPGVIRRVGTLQRLVFGEFDGARSPRLVGLLDACKAAGIASDLSTDITREIWEKFVFLVAYSGATTAMRATIGPVRDNPQTRAFLRDLMLEAIAVGRAMGVTITDAYVDKRMATMMESPPEQSSSMHHDLNQGSRLEVPWLSGGVVELGKKAGVPTPLNRAVADILALQADGSTPLMGKAH